MTMPPIPPEHAVSEPTDSERSSFEPVAIIGVGMRAPGNINDFTTLWDTLVHRKSHHSCLSTDPRLLKRFNEKDFEAVFSATPDSRETLYANLLEETPGLDEEFFGVNKRDSACMDAQLKLLLHVSHEALEDSGFSGMKDGSAGDPDTFGVFIGSLSDDFCRDVNTHPIDIYHLVRNQRAFLAGQISHHFGLRGPSVSVDTACSSSMTAINDACRALATGECQAAIAGGVQVMSPFSTPSTTIALSQAGFLSTNGQCKPFLADGDGYCRSEACGVVVLKLLSDALREGDRIHGIIRSIGVGNMASSQSIIRPDGHLQSAILSRALALARVQPSQVSFVEAHGPGTKQGDFAEIFSIWSVLGRRCRTADDPLAIGSIKGNIGHSEAASGALSLFKVLAMVRFGRLAPQATFHAANLNPSIQSFFEDKSIRISDHECDWEAPRRIAVVNNFGAAGYAGSMVIEEPVRVSIDPSCRLDKLRLPFLISAKSPAAFAALTRRYSSWLRAEGASKPLSAISYTMTTRRVRHPYFAMFNAGSHEELGQRILEAEGRKRSVLKSASVIFCFSGQGGPPSDPRESSLYGVSREYTSTVDLCFQLAEAGNFFAEDDVHILGLFALQMGLANMWCCWGLKPAAYAGHSFGEYAALVKAGVIDLEDALRIIGIRAALIRKNCTNPPSKMASLHLPLSKVRGLLETQIRTEVELACINSDTHVTLAGTEQDLLEFRSQTLMMFPTACWRFIDHMKVGFHSRFMDPICEPLLQACQGTRMNPSHSVVVSGLLGRAGLPGDPALLRADYFSRHCRETNDFNSAVKHYKHYLGSDTDQPDWIEIGPHSTTIGFIPVTGTQRKYPSHVIGSSRWDTITKTFISLGNGGHDINFHAFHRDVNPSASHYVELPRYPLTPRPHVYPNQIDNSAGRPLLQISSLDIMGLMQNHVVAGHSLCPASIYISMALVANNKRVHHSGFHISRLKMTCPFTAMGDAFLETHPVSSSPSYELKGQSGTLHASLQLHCVEEVKLLETLQLFSPLVLSFKFLMNSGSTNVLDTRLVYGLLGQAVQYGPMFQGLQKVWIAENGCQGWCSIPNDIHDVHSRTQVEPDSLRSASPILLDLMYQFLGFLVNTSDARESGEIFLATEISDIEIAWEAVRSSRSFECYSSFELHNTPKSKNGLAVGQVFTFDHSNRLVAVFRGVRMLKMTASSLDTVVSEASGSLSTTTSAIPLTHNSPCSLENAVMTLFKRTLCVQELYADTLFSELGLDSLTSTELWSQLRRLFPSSKLSSELFRRPDASLRMVFEAVGLSCTSIPRNPTPPPASNPEVVQFEASTIPLLLIHDGTGMSSAYRNLKDIGRTVLALRAPGLYTSKGTGSIRDTGYLYGSMLQTWMKQNAYSVARVLVGGWSLGGILALSLTAANPDLVAGVILIDSPPSGTAAMTESEARQYIPALYKSSSDELRQLLQTQLELNSQSLTEFQEEEDLLYQSLDVPIGLISASDPVPLEGKDTLASCSQWLTRDDHMLATQAGWEDALGNKLIMARDTPGNHFNLFDVEHSSTTSACLKEVANTVLSFAK